MIERINYKMIGHDSADYSFDNESEVSKKIIVPLIFWFCQDSTKSLPLLSMKYTSPKINLKINKIKI